MITNRIARSAVLVAAMTIAGASQLQAMQVGQPAPQDPERGAEVSAASDRAVQLMAEAEALFSQPKQWRRAARLLERSAQLREAEDAGGYACLLLAGSLRAATGNYAMARQNYEKAAAHAIARGAVVEAAHAYIDAAHAAAQEKQPQLALSLVERAALLAHSPLLTAEQAQNISRRIS